MKASAQSMGLLEIVKVFFNKLHNWRSKHIGNSTFLIIASIIVGLVSALAAVVLKKGVHYLQYLSGLVADVQSVKFVYIVLPLCGIMITFLLIRYFSKNKFDKGLGSIIYDISWNSGNIKWTKTFSHVVTSGITVGLGGSAGLEAPIAVTGSAIGSNMAKVFKLGYNERVILLACGAASGITAVFNSPVAGVIFAMEILLTSFSIPVFIPLLISAASSALLTNFIYKGQLFYLVTDKWHFEAIPFYILLGIICGLFSVYMSRVTLFVEGKLNRKKSILKPILGGLVLGGLIYLMPPLYGEGYLTIEELLKNSYTSLLQNSFFSGLADHQMLILVFVAAIILIKPFATAITIGSGGNGGIFAPSLFTGALMGFSVAFFVNSTGLMKLSTVNFIAVGMAGILSGVVRAPLTSIFLIAEVTGGYVLFVPLMIVSALSYFIARFFEPYSVYTKKLAQKGHLMTEDKDMNTLNILKVRDVVEKDFVTLGINDTLEDFVKAFKKSNRNTFPVIDENNTYYGVIYLEKVKEYLFDPEMYHKILIRDLMVYDATVISIDDNMVGAMQKFETARAWNLIVLDGDRYAGVVSKSNVIMHYRQVLKRSVHLF